MRSTVCLKLKARPLNPEAKSVVPSGHPPFLDACCLGLVGGSNPDLKSTFDSDLWFEYRSYMPRSMYAESVRDRGSNMAG